MAHVRRSPLRYSPGHHYNCTGRPADSSHFNPTRRQGCCARFHVPEYQIAGGTKGASRPPFPVLPTLAFQHHLWRHSAVSIPLEGNKSFRFKIAKGLWCCGAVLLSCTHSYQRHLPWSHRRQASGSQSLTSSLSHATLYSLHSAFPGPLLLRYT